MITKGRRNVSPCFFGSRRYAREDRLFSVIARRRRRRDTGLHQEIKRPLISVYLNYYDVNIWKILFFYAVCCNFKYNINEIFYFDLQKILKGKLWKHYGPRGGWSIYGRRILPNHAFSVQEKIEIRTPTVLSSILENTRWF